VQGGGGWLQCYNDDMLNDMLLVGGHGPTASQARNEEGCLGRGTKNLEFVRDVGQN
jgi:hypothetical protein